MFVADGGKSVQKLLEPTGEPLRPEMAMYAQAKELGAYDMWQLHLERNELQKKYFDQWLSYDGLDAILCPTTPFASVAHGGFIHVGYTGGFNVLDYSAVSFPTGVVADNAKDKAASDYKPLSDLCKMIHDKCKSY